MNKEEKIKEAWDNLLRNIKNYKLTKKQYDLNGWVNLDILSSTLRSYLANNQSSELELNIKNNTIRPKSLQGIENNNGWIKIESESDLPNKKGVYDVIFENNPKFVNRARFCNINKCFFSLLNRKITGTKATHYQPIEKPKPPIY